MVNIGKVTVGKGAAFIITAAERAKRAKLRYFKFTPIGLAGGSASFATKRQ